MASAPVSSIRWTISAQASGFDSTMAETITARSGQLPLHFGDLAQIDLDGAIGDELDVVDGEHPLPGVVPGAVAIGDIQNRRADGFPDDSAPAGFEGFVNLRAGIGGRRGSKPERVGRLDAGEIDPKVGHYAATSFFMRLREPRWMAAAANLPS